MKKNKSHVNPNCYDPRFCLPHGEIGEVKYDVERIFAYIKELETYQKELVKKIEKKMAGNVYSVDFHRLVLKSIKNKENKYQLLCANCNWIKRYENKEWGRPRRYK